GIFPVPPERTHVIPHGDESLFLRMADRGGDLREDYGIPADAPVVGFFGGLRPSKGLNDLIDAFAVVHDEVPGSRLVIAGLPTAEVDPDDLETRAARLGVGAAVTVDARYLPIEDVGPLVRTADVIALPYRTGTASGALQVAYAFERPVVASDAGSVSEAVVDGTTGIVVPAADPDALARALVKVLADRAEAHAMGVAGRRHAAEHHAWEPIAHVILTVSETAREERR
ncbi:MAG TPA: glycosyltransferase family 4 protein, partial [Acidimicrobiia bacterium]|nr:glycosyltransferase family 4 protein [Acidimicrobiia bacterium]